MSADQGSLLQRIRSAFDVDSPVHKNLMLRRAYDEIERLQIELTAIGIYNAFPYNGEAGPTKPTWVPFGNSMKQDEARRLARKSIAESASVK